MLLHMLTLSETVHRAFSLRGFARSYSVPISRVHFTLISVFERGVTGSRLSTANPPQGPPHWRKMTLISLIDSDRTL